MLHWLTISAIQDWYWIITVLPLFLVGAALILLGALIIVAAPFAILAAGTRKASESAKPVSGVGDAIRGETERLEQEEITRQRDGIAECRARVADGAGARGAHVAGRHDCGV
jgi:hypothetical protein